MTTGWSRPGDPFRTLPAQALPAVAGMPVASRAGDSPAAGPQVRPAQLEGCRPSLGPDDGLDAVTSGSLPDCSDPRWTGPDRTVLPLFGRP